MRRRLCIHKAEPNVGALDFRYLLDAPAGKHGFVSAKDGHLYFEDGTRARFIGFNLPARSDTPTHETADRMAERFASLGVNVIRLHAADAPPSVEQRSWSSCEDAPLIDYSSGTTGRFHPEGLDRFDYFIAKLREKGIYLHIDLIVARRFLPGDGAPENLPGCMKCYTMINERLIRLQQEYARELLCHLNPYTGLRLIDDPAVMTVQINNEDSVIKERDTSDATRVYSDELSRKFSDWLIEKYGDRATLAEAWTYDGICALGDDEDPVGGTVRVVQGSFVQPVCEPMGDWAGGVPRYADYMAFGIEMNRRFYQRMKRFLRDLGVKAPIATSNLLGGAADVYGHIDADVMENNSYFNHPLLPTPGPCMYITAGPTEYVSVNTLTMQRGIGAMATSLISLASEAAVAGKPFILSEWNEYGLHPFHSTAYLSTIAYACLNDWDGLILYCHHTSENFDNQPADEILNVFDAYNDPALICEWGFLASVFLNGLISPSKRRVDIVFTQADLLTLPNAHGMPNTFLPYITNMRNVFLSDNELYRGDADVAVNAGYVNNRDLSCAAHGVYYAWSPYRDAFRRSRGDTIPHAEDKDLVIANISEIAGGGDYRQAAALFDGAMKKWGVLPDDCGVIDGRITSDTGEIISDPSHSRFFVNTPCCACFSGKPDGVIPLGENITVRAANERVTLTLLPHKGGKIDEVSSFIITAIGETGMDETEITPVDVWPGMPFSMVNMKGKLFADTLEGEMLVNASSATLEALSPTGMRLAMIEGEKTGSVIRFKLSGELPSVNFKLTLVRGGAQV